MNKKYVYWGIGLLAIGGIAYFAIRSKGKQSESTGDDVLDSSKLTPEVNVKMPEKKLKLIKGGKSSGLLSKLNKATKKPLLAEKVQKGVDPRMDEAMRNRDEANSIRNKKGISNIKWIAEMQGQKLTVRQQMFMNFKKSSASPQEMLDASVTMLNWSKNR